MAGNGIVHFMNNVKTIKSSSLRRLRSVLLVFLWVAVPLGYYLVFFVVRANFREVVPQKVYRSAQPSPAQLRGWIRRYGIRTVINLRGDAGKITADARAVANEMGAKMVSIGLDADEIPHRPLLAKLIQTIETAERPMLIHCRAGVDRSGMASTLAAMAIGKMDYDTAKWQAYVPPGPWKRERECNYLHISDTFKLYESYCQRNGLHTNGWQKFKQWAADDNSLVDKDMKYKFSYSYFPLFDKNKRFFPIVKLARGAYIQFTAELVLLSLLAVVIYRKLMKN